MSRGFRAMGGACGLVLFLALFASLGERRSAGEPKAPAAGQAAPVEAKNHAGKAAELKLEPADNSYCYVCHANYEGEKLVHGHEKAGVGCEKCHGESAKHSGDEDGLTPPDKMFPKAEVNPYCISCHEKNKLLKRDEHKDWFKDLEEDESCNDCHGEKHRLKVRTRIWDKKTRKLLKDDGVRMMQKDSPATQGVGRKAKGP